MRALAVDPLQPDPAAIREAAQVLREGRLVAFPTETVYGLGARVFDEAALARVFRAKGRPPTHPLIAHVLSEDEARALAAKWNDRASRLTRAFWPGPLTLVVERAGHVPAIVSGGAASLGIRAPAHPVARALLTELGEPLAAPSANRYQQLSPTTAEHVRRSLGEEVDLVLDAGACPAGIESTVLDVRSDPPRVLRPGAIDIGALRRIEPTVDLGVASTAERPSPGMDPRHYAPRAKLVVVPDRLQAVAMATSRAQAGERVGLLLRGGADVSSDVSLRVLADDPVGYGRELYAVLHAFDEEGVACIVVEAVPRDERWLAVADRLRRGGAS